MSKFLVFFFNKHRPMYRILHYPQLVKFDHFDSLSSWGQVRTSVADPDPWNPYHFPGSGSISKNGWIRDPDPYQIIRIRIRIRINMIRIRHTGTFVFLILLCLNQNVCLSYPPVVRLSYQNMKLQNFFFFFLFLENIIL